MKINFYHIILIALLLASCKGNKFTSKTGTNDGIDTTKVDPYSCEWGRIESAKDLKKDSLMLIRYGLPEASSDYYWNILRSEYHVYVKFGTGCEVDDGILCYNEVMENKIKEKYGEDIFTKVSNKADSLFKLENKK